MGLEERKILINRFMYTNFNYCPVVWYFNFRESTNKIEYIQKSIKFLLNDYSSDDETLLKKTNKCTS